ncbi:hypothetical protein MCERHM31_00792 [Methylophilaceae bacterium]
MANLMTGDNEIARLMSGLKLIDNNLARLDKAVFFEKTQIAEATIHDTRILLGHIVLTMHMMKNDLHRLSGLEA